LQIANLCGKDSKGCHVGNSLVIIERIEGSGRSV